MTVLLLACVAVVLAAVTLAAAIHSVPAGHHDLVERRGRHHRVLDPGTSLIVPLLDRVVGRVEAGPREQIIAPGDLRARDDSVITIGLTAYYSVVDPWAAYLTGDLARSVSRLLLSTLRDQIGEMRPTQVAPATDAIRVKLRHTLNRVAREWGIEVDRVLVVVEPRAEPAS